MKNYLLTILGISTLAVAAQVHATTNFVFCSLRDNNGCTGMAMDKFTFNNIRKPYFFATSHTEQGLFTLTQLIIATSATNKSCTLLQYDGGKNPCEHNVGLFDKNPYHDYERDWNTNDFIAGESDGSIIPYLAFDNGTFSEVKVYLAPHGSSEFKPTFYEPKNPDQQYYKICINDLGTVLPSNARKIQGYQVINNGSNLNFTSKDQLLSALTSYGFTTSATDPNPSLIFGNCP